MNDKGYFTSDGVECTVWKQPKYEWECRVLENITWSCEEGKQPNWFHRKMQYLAFGFKWSRIK